MVQFNVTQAFPAGSNTDECDALDVDFAVGDVLSVEVTQPSSAADLTVGLKAFSHALDPAV